MALDHTKQSHIHAICTADSVFYRPDHTLPRARHETDLEHGKGNSYTFPVKLICATDQCMSNRREFWKISWILICSRLWVDRGGGGANHRDLANINLWIIEETIPTANDP